MRKLFVLLAFLLLQAPSYAASNLELEAGNLVQLISHTSQYAKIKGTISNIDVSDKYNVVSLNFGKNFNTSLSALIFNDALHSFIASGISEPSEYFKNKTVVLEGVIRILNGKPEIVIDSPSKIKIVDQ